MNKTTMIVLFSSIIFGGCTLAVPKNIPVTPTSTPTQSMPGSDRDSHGCIPSAGYSWCEAKQKCLRVWEEPCVSTPSATPKTTPTVDETDAIKASIKKDLVTEHGDTANELTITISKIDGNFAQGMASASGGGGIWFAAKVNNIWKLVWDGNGTIQCTDLSSYPDFPKTMIPECYDQQSDKMVKR